MTYMPVMPSRGGAYRNTGAMDINPSFPMTPTLINLVSTGDPVQLMVSVYYRNNTGVTQTSSATFGRFTGINGTTGTSTGWTRLGSIGGFDATGTGSGGAGNGPMTRLWGFYTDNSTLAGQGYTYAVWWSNGSDGSGVNWMAGVDMSFSVG